MTNPAYTRSLNNLIDEFGKLPGIGGTLKARPEHFVVICIGRLGDCVTCAFQDRFGVKLQTLYSLTEAPLAVMSPPDVPCRQR